MNGVCSWMLVRNIIKIGKKKKFSGEPQDQVSTNENVSRGLHTPHETLS